MSHVCRSQEISDASQGNKDLLRALSHHGQVHQFLEKPSAGRFFILLSPSGYKKSQALRSWQSVADSHQCICLQYHLVSLSYDLVALSALIMEFMQMRYVHSKWLSLLRLWRPGIWQLNIGMRFAVE